MARRKKPDTSPEVLDELLDGRDPKQVVSSDGLIGELKKALAERILDAEMDEHLGTDGEQSEGNHRNGHSKKTVLTESSALELSIPCDRHGRFEPQLVEKYRHRFPGFDEKIIALYARGMCTRDIQAHITELYGLEISPGLVSAVTDAVLDGVTAWQNRPLESVYAITYFDALRTKIRDEGSVRNKATCLAIGIRCDGTKEILGLWIEQNEGAKFWLKVMTALKNRGVEDILVAVVDGLKGFPETIKSVFPETRVQSCIVHLIRYSLKFARWKERKAVAADFKQIYRAETAEAELRRLEEFEEGEWGQKHPTTAQSWRRRWAQVIPFFSNTRHWEFFLNDQHVRNSSSLDFEGDACPTQLATGLMLVDE